MFSTESVVFDMSVTTQSTESDGQDPKWFNQFLEDYDYELPKRGQILEGQIIRIDEDAIIVDIGLKRDAIVTSRDLNLLDNDYLASLKVGDDVMVYVLRPPVGDDDLLVSIHKGLEHKSWEKAERYMEESLTLDLPVVSENRGGLLVEFESLRGFVPNSQVPDLRRRDRQKTRSLKLEMIGQVLPLKIIEVNRDRHRLILSAIAAQEERRKERLQELEKGQIILGRVVNIVNFGLFVDLNGVDGLVHISEIDWQRVNHPSELFKVGDEIQVKVLDVDIEKERISLSRKALLPSPWQTLAEKYDPGDLIEGNVTKVLDFGAFIELPEGVEGLVHTSEIGYSTTGTPQEVVRAGEKVLVRVLSIDSGRERISLSMRQVPLEKQIAWMVEQEDLARAEKEAQAGEELATAEDQPDTMASAQAEEAETTADQPDSMEGTETSKAVEPETPVGEETLPSELPAAEEPKPESE